MLNINMIKSFWIFIFLLLFLLSSCQNAQGDDDIPQIQVNNNADITETTDMIKIIEITTMIAEPVTATETAAVKETTKTTKTIETTEMTTEMITIEKITATEPAVNITETEMITTAPEITTAYEIMIDTETITIKKPEKPAVEVATTATTAAPALPPTTAAPTTNPPPPAKALKIPVFMYHTSSEDEPGDYPDLYIKLSEFEKQIKYLCDNGYTFCTFNDWFVLYNTKKPVFITFDDGYKENYTEIFPILQKYNAKITIFLTTEPETERLTVDMIREMSDSGLVKFESHTATHPDLAQISSDTARLTGELKNSKLKIEEITGKTVLAISYPSGSYNRKVIQKAKEFYLFGVIDDLGLGMHNSNVDDFQIRRIAVGRYTSLNSFIRLLGK